MANNLISIIISASDAASGVIKGVVGTLDDIGGSAIKVGAALTAATAPIAGFFAASIQQASEQEAALSQLNAVLKSTGGISGVTADMADRLSSSLSKVTRFSDDAVLGAENMLLTFTNIGKDIFPDVTRTALDMSQALGQDLKSSSIQLGKALNSPIEGATALRRVGVQFTDSQEAMIKSMVESGHLLDAQKLILGELSREFGGSAEAAGKTFAGAMDIAAHKVGELQEKIGFILMPTLQRVIGVVGNVVDKIADWSEKNPGLTKTIVAIGAALVAAGPILIGVGTAIKLVTAETGAFKIALSALSGPVGIIIAVIGALFLAYQTNFLGIRDLVQPILKTLGEGLSKIGEQVNVFVARFREGGLREAVHGFFAVFEDGSSTISTILQGFGMNQGTADGIAQWFQNAFGKVKPVFDGVIEAVEYFVKGFATNIQLVPFYIEYFVGGIWNKVQPMLQPMLDWFSGTGENSLSGALSSVGNFVTDNVVTPLQNIWTDVQPHLQDLLDWFTGSGANSLQGVIASVPDWISQHITAPLNGLWTVIQPAVQPILNFFNGTGTDSLSGVIGLVGGTLNDLKNSFMNFWNDIQPKLSPITKGLQDLIQPFVNLTNTALDNWEKLRRIGGGAAERTLPGEISPGVANPAYVPPGPKQADSVADVLGAMLFNPFATMHSNIDYSKFFSDGIKTQQSSAFLAGVGFGQGMITDSFIPLGNIMFEGIGTLKQPAFHAGVGLGNGLITATVPLGTQYMGGITSMSQASYNAGALVGQAIKSAASLLGSNFTSGVTSMQEAAFNAGAALGNLLKGVATKVAQVAQQIPAVTETIGAGPGGLPPVTGTAALHDYAGAYSANTPYIVNPSAAPELFIPSTSGMAIPNADQLGSRSFGDVTNNFPNVTNETKAEEIRVIVYDALAAL